MQLITLRFVASHVASQPLEERELNPRRKVVMDQSLPGFVEDSLPIGSTRLASCFALHLLPGSCGNKACSCSVKKS